MKIIEKLSTIEVIKRFSDSLVKKVLGFIVFVEDTFYPNFKKALCKQVAFFKGQLIEDC